MSARMLQVGVALPVLGMLVLIGRAEYRVQTGDRWQVAIEGYDPRDLIRGQYLNFRYRFDFAGADSCGAKRDRNQPEPGCCLCLSASPDRSHPTARNATCVEAQRCDGWVKFEEVEGAQQYFVPEHQGRPLERALRHRSASVDLALTHGEVNVLELRIDGRPWRDAGVE